MDSAVLSPTLFSRRLSLSIAMSAHSITVY